MVHIIMPLTISSKFNIIKKSNSDQFNRLTSYKMLGHRISLFSGGPIFNCPVSSYIFGKWDGGREFSCPFSFFFFYHNSCPSSKNIFPSNILFIVVKIPYIYGPNNMLNSHHKQIHEVKSNVKWSLQTRKKLTNNTSRNNWSMILLVRITPSIMDINAKQI